MARLFTGLQPSGALHIGNYFGALKPAVEMCATNDGLVMVADYHSLTSLTDVPRRRGYILDVVRDYIGVGLDPHKTILFKQSDVPEHTELAWIFDCLVTVSFLELSHAYKDKVAKGLEANAGLFTYPMLMAADILLYDTDIVPVGADQRQHVEYAREAAAKFNKTYGTTFKEPKEHILESVAVIPGTDGKKMSKSYKNTIPLFGTRDEIAAAVMSIVTDSSGERPAFVYAIHRAFKSETELEKLYDDNKGKYKILKEALIEDIDSMIAPMREKRNALTDTEIKVILHDGGEAARALAGNKMKAVRSNIGVSL